MRVLVDFHVNSRLQPSENSSFIGSGAKICSVKISFMNGGFAVKQTRAKVIARVLYHSSEKWPIASERGLLYVYLKWLVWWHSRTLGNAWLFFQATGTGIVYIVGGLRASRRRR